MNYLRCFDTQAIESCSLKTLKGDGVDGSFTCLASAIFALIPNIQLNRNQSF